MSQKTRKKLTTDFNQIVTLEIGQSFDGVYVEMKLIPVDGEMRKLYTFSTLVEGEAVEKDIWGSGQFNQYMAKVKPGTHCYITRLDDIPSPTFPNTKMKNFEFEIED